MKFKELPKIKYAVVYNRDGRLNQDGTALIQIRAYQGGRKPRSRFFSTGIYIEPPFWDDRNKQVKHTHPLQFRYNQAIRDQREAIEAHEIKLIQRFGSCSIALLDGYDQQEEQPVEVSFLDFCREELERPEITANTRKSQRDAINKLSRYRKAIYFEDLDFQFIVGFDRYLRRLGLNANSRDKHHRTIKSYISRAIAYDYLPPDRNPYRKFKSETEEPHRVFLTPEELEKLERLQVPADKAYLEKIRRIFLLACYTGLRYGDLTSFGRRHLEETRKGLQLTMRIEKTRKAQTLPLWLLFRRDGIQWSRPEEIIRQAMEEQGTLYRRSALEGLPLFRISMQHLNRGLKDLAALAGINKHLTSHVGRRTFATIMATKVKAPVLQRLLNHSRLDITMIYVRLSNRMIEEELESIDWNK